MGADILAQEEMDQLLAKVGTMTKGCWIDRTIQCPLGGRSISEANDSGYPCTSCEHFRQNRTKVVVVIDKLFDKDDIVNERVAEKTRTLSTLNASLKDELEQLQTKFDAFKEKIRRAFQ